MRNRLGCILVMAGLIQVLVASFLLAVLYMQQLQAISQLDPGLPQQIHISLGKSSSDMVVTWVTLTYSDVTVVQYGHNSSALSDLQKGSCSNFTDGGSEKRILYIHKVVLNPLKPDQVYYYRAGSKTGWSTVYHFKTMKSGTDWSPLVAVYGDLGSENGVSIPLLREQAQQGNWDAVFHVGDFGYDLASDNARVGDKFMNQIQPVAAHVPYMTCPGNHEYHYHFSNYIHRFNNPTPDGYPMFYSFDMGPAHIISVNTEIYFYATWNYTGADQAIMDQQRFLSEDLKRANEPKNRAQRPWIIVMGHRPLYCTNNDGDFCSFAILNPERLGLYNLTTQKLYPGLENIFYEQGVDLEIYAHEHSYERLWPIFNMLVCNGTEAPYVNPRAPVHIITGSAGNKERLDPFIKPPFYYSAFRADDYGFTKLRIYNSTHLRIQQISADKGGKVIDDVTVVKEKHGTGIYDCHKK